MPADVSPLPGPLALRVQEYLASGWPDDRILRGLEEEGADIPTLLAAARFLVSRTLPGMPEAFHDVREELAFCLALGALRRWRPFRALAKELYLHQCHWIAYPWLTRHEVMPLSFGQRVLRRLGYPDLHSEQTATEKTPGFLRWLERGGRVCLESLSLQGISTRQERWELGTSRLKLIDAAGPRVLHHTTMPGCEGQDSLRLVRVRRLRSVVEPAQDPPLFSPRNTRLLAWRASRSTSETGIRRGDKEGLFTLVALDCPELRHLQTRPSVLVLKRCPQVTSVRCDRRGKLLHLDTCASLRRVSLVPCHGYRRSRGDLFQGSIHLAHCPQLTTLPSPFRGLTGHLLLRHLEAFHFQPDPLHIGGHLQIRDCPRIERFPALRAVGSIAVEGRNTLRILGPMEVGGDLDLRACRDLEGIPDSVRVRGGILLPPHLA